MAGQPGGGQGRVVEPESPSGPSKPSDPERANLGVLFVHGIGKQVRGQTLAEWGGPLYRWFEDRFSGLDRHWNWHYESQLAGMDADKKAGLQRWRDAIERWADDGFHGDPPTSPQPGKEESMASEIVGDTLVARAVVVDTLLSDPLEPDAPAHSRWLLRRLNTKLEIQRDSWLLAESTWANAFAPPGFRELARWILQVIPWTLGDHFAGRVRLRWSTFRRIEEKTDPRVGIQLTTEQKAPGPFRKAVSWFSRRGELMASWISRLWGLMAALAGLVGGLLLSPLLLTAFAALLLAAAVPVPQLRSALLRLQLGLASTLGDSYILLARPIEAASIIGQVSRDLRWLSERCKVVAVVAHSQGGAVVHEVLRSQAPSNLRLLFTFGSGLKKLEKLRQLGTSGDSYRRSARWTLFALLGFGLFSTWFAWGWASGALQTLVKEDPDSVVSMIFWLAVSLAFLVAGIWDHMRGIDLSRLKHRVSWLTAPGRPRAPTREGEPGEEAESGGSTPAWIDCFATADPVSNGFLLPSAEIEKISKEVSNRAAMLRDHTTYWSNRDQFVTLLATLLTDTELRQATARFNVCEYLTRQSREDRIGPRRRWRLRIAAWIRATFAVSLLFAVFRSSEEWKNFVTFATGQLAGWLTSFLGGAPTERTVLAPSGRALGLLLLAAAPYWIASRSWRAWNRDAMRANVATVAPPHEISVFLTFALQLTALGLLAVWDWDLLLLGVVVVLVLLGAAAVWVGKPPPVERRPIPANKMSETRAEALLSFLIQIALLASLGTAVLSFFWSLVVKIVDRFFSGTIFGWQPVELSGCAPYWIVALLATIVSVLLMLWRKASAPDSTTSGGT